MSDACATTPGLKSHKTSWRFYMCAAILVLAAGGMQLAAGLLKGYFRKSPLPLKRPLHMLDQTKLLPEYSLYKIQPAPLSHELVENLGTEEYLQWHLVDRRKDRDDSASLALLFITYNTGGPGLVPHRPQECMAAAGMELKDSEVVEFEIADADGVTHAVPVCILEFALPRRGMQLQGGVADADTIAVAYFFYANGSYATTRTGVRLAVSSMTDKYAYYSKIELTFSNDTSRRRAGRAETEEATRRLLQKVMPILWSDHYQDWEALNRGESPVLHE